MIWGTIYANGGEIGGCSIENGVLKISSINMKDAITWDNLSDELSEDISGAISAADNASDMVEKIANGEYIGGTLINGKMIYSPTIYGGEIYWGGNDALGGLLRTTGSAPDSSGETYETNLVHLWTSDGMLLEANGGGMRLWASNGLWLQNYPKNIYIGTTSGWISLENYVKQNAGGSSVAVFG